MPLVRFEVRNEYRLGQPGLYKETNRDDPKAVLDGVAVAGLVGILRQLGDLAEFAGEVFHGLQEQVMSTASRSHKLLVRVQNIEAALPSLEKAVLAQTSHIHFAYTAGSEWRSRIPNGQNHFIYNDLPRFIMDSYEECRDPPRLHLLDKFDTGGPGSCLRRYSDPTFFRRASTNFSQPDAEKVPKEKKPRKNKKKRSSLRNVDFLHSASMPNRSGRMAFSTPLDNGRSSSHTTSTNGITVKSDMGYHSNSFDSRTGSDYMESVFRSNASVKPEEREPEEEISSSFRHHNEVADSVFSNEQPSTATDDFLHNSSPDRNAACASSSCGTWDEKAEIVEPKGQNSDENEVAEMLTTDHDLDIQNEDIVRAKDPAQTDLEYDFENRQRLRAVWNEMDEVESETDNFMDALNTIESESENDLDFQAKHELERFSANVDDDLVEVDVSKDREFASEENPSEFESHGLPDISLDKEIVSDLPEIPLETVVHEHNPPISEEVSNSENLPDVQSSEIPDDLDGPVREILVGEPSSSNHKGIEDSTSPNALGCSEVESIIGEPSKVESSFGDSTTPNAICTPKVESTSEPSSSGFGISNVGEQNTVSSFPKHESSPAEISSSYPVSIWTNGGLLGLQPSKPPDFSVSRAAGTANSAGIPSSQDDTYIRSYNGNGERLGSIESISSSNLEGQNSKVDKSGDFHQSNGKTSAAKPMPDAAASSTGASRENVEYPTHTFGLGHRLLLNSFSRKLSLVPDGKAEVAKAGSLNQSSTTHQAAPEKIFSESYGFKPFSDSLTSSPPLDHMKISFQPFDGSDGSKLNLKFPDSNGSMRDMFSSFQLVPEPGISVQYVGSDSDDDTFCRSSPNISDDCLSRRSDSDSEQWDSGDSPENISGSQQAGEITEGAVPLDLPSFDSVQGKLQENIGQEDLMDLQCSKESKPPPPLPPPVRRLTKSTSCVVEEKQNINLQGSTVYQQPKPATAIYQQVNEEAIVFRLKSKDQWKQNVHKEAIRPIDDKEVDEKDDFLNQIRTKSFTLRRTVTAKANISSGPAANNKVTAILEKANAIRQAVGSDDGEDDSWSDT